MDNEQALWLLADSGPPFMVRYPRNDKEMKYRLSSAKEQGVPVVNYGVAIAQMHGILKRSLEIFPQYYEKI